MLGIAHDIYLWSELVVIDGESDDRLQRIHVAGQLGDPYSNSIHLNVYHSSFWEGMNTWLLGAPNSGYTWGGWFC